MTLSKLINKAVEEFDKEFTEYGRATFCCCGDQCDGDHTDDIKDIKSFLTNCIKESYEAGREEENKRVLEVISEIIKMSNENSSTDWFDGLRCIRESVELQSLTQEVKEGK